LLRSSRRTPLEGCALHRGPRRRVDARHRARCSPLKVLVSKAFVSLFGRTYPRSTPRRCASTWGKTSSKALDSWPSTPALPLPTSTTDPRSAREPPAAVALDSRLAVIAGGLRAPGRHGHGQARARARAPRCRPPAATMQGNEGRQGKDGAPGDASPWPPRPRSCPCDRTFRREIYAAGKPRLEGLAEPRFCSSPCQILPFSPAESVLPYVTCSSVFAYVRTSLPASSLACVAAHLPGDPGDKGHVSTQRVKIGR
jgi:hypothetical protein